MHASAPARRVRTFGHGGNSHATRNPADVLGILETTGPLEAVKRANLFVVNSDPIRDIATLSSQDSICMVMQDGLIQMAGDFDPNETGKMKPNAINAASA